jgi:hypothetical protein
MGTKDEDSAKVSRELVVIQKTPNSGEDDESQYSLSTVKRAVIMTGLSLAVLLMALDTSIVATAIPAITTQFGSSDEIGWYGAAYSLSLCTLQPVMGKIFANFSLKVFLQN